VTLPKFDGSLGLLTTGKILNNTARWH
jgi:hypothetical protein